MLAAAAPAFLAIVLAVVAAAVAGNPPFFLSFFCLAHLLLHQLTRISHLQTDHELIQDYI